jgi:hypothetical protein
MMCYFEWLKAVGPIAIALAVFFVTVWFYRWQKRLATEKLRHDLYERRFAIYVAFRDLLLALPDLAKSDDEIKAACRKASIARFEALFLLDDPKIQAYLEDLCRQANGVIGDIVFLDATMKQPAWTNDPQVVRDVLERSQRLGAAKLDLPNRHLEELPQRFTQFLRLTDFLK